jgi:hypothetical protein
MDTCKLFPRGIVEDDNHRLPKDMITLYLVKDKLYQHAAAWAQGLVRETSAEEPRGRASSQRAYRHWIGSRMYSQTVEVVGDETKRTTPLKVLKYWSWRQATHRGWTEAIENAWLHDKLGSYQAVCALLSRWRRFHAK